MKPSHVEAEIASGLICAVCHTIVDGREPGYRRTHEDCEDYEPEDIEDMGWGLCQDDNVD